MCTVDQDGGMALSSGHPARLLPGHSHPLGARPDGQGVHFCVYSGDAEAIELLLYNHVDDAEPAQTITLSTSRHRTWHYWHVYVQGLGPGQLYAYRAHGPFDPLRGQRFDGDKVLLDPYGRAVAIPRQWQRSAACAPGRNDAQACKSVVADDHAYDWEGDRPLHRPFSHTVIYELHVRGFTAHPSSGVDPHHRGTFTGLIEKIPYLRALGITAVELLPVFHFDSQDAPPGLLNYWGYAPLSFFALHGAYGSRQDPLGVLDEFRDMVKALHRAGIEVFLDVVYNHTAEGNEAGPTVSLRGLDNATYYLMDDSGHYANYSGCGNTLNANTSVVRRLIVDSLHYWVRVMHVDGFRFDLAAILSRDERGTPLAAPPILWDIESDPVLAGTKLIAEAWDAAGLYQVGHFMGERWKEWNGQFRDNVRLFVRGDPGQVRELSDRVLGSPALYESQPHESIRSINFVTSHDGFTLRDLVSYDHKHNEANLEGNRDGSPVDWSWNCGAEGPSDQSDIRALRLQQSRNLLTLTIMSLGTPMIVMGDEMGRTQAGNNNAYCQDNAISWLDWSLLETEGPLHRFTAGLLRLRRHRESLRCEHPLSLTELMARLRTQVHGLRCGVPDLSESSHHLAVSLHSLRGDLLMYWALNAGTEALDFELPALPLNAKSPWKRVVDTGQPSPADVSDLAAAPHVTSATLSVAARSCVLLFAELPAHER